MLAIFRLSLDLIDFHKTWSSIIILKGFSLRFNIGLTLVRLILRVASIIILSLKLKSVINPNYCFLKLRYSLELSILKEFPLNFGFKAPNVKCY